jgi:hypothetical protein
MIMSDLFRRLIKEANTSSRDWWPSMRDRGLLSRRVFLAMGTYALLVRGKGTAEGPALPGQDDDCKQCCPLPSVAYPKAVKAFLAPVRPGFCSVSADPKAGFPFTVCAIFDETQDGYTKYEYRQYVRGYMSYLDPVAGWTNSCLGLRGTASLSAHDYHEDGYTNGTAYGYRDPNSRCCDDTFGPLGYDRQRGWLYTMSDFPGLTGLPRQTKYKIRLDFCFDLVDSSTSPETVIDRGRLPVRCCGDMPAIEVCSDSDLPKKPPGPDLEVASLSDRNAWMISVPKQFEGYYSRVMIERRPTATVARVCIMKPNDAPRIESQALKLNLFDLSEKDLGAPTEGLLVEANSASTTAQKSFIFPPVTEISKATVFLNHQSMDFGTAEFDVR